MKDISDILREAHHDSYNERIQGKSPDFKQGYALGYMSGVCVAEMLVNAMRKSSEDILKIVKHETKK
jgi:hypothetical protein